MQHAIVEILVKRGRHRGAEGPQREREHEQQDQTGVLAGVAGELAQAQVGGDAPEPIAGPAQAGDDPRKHPQENQSDGEHEHDRNDDQQRIGEQLAAVAKGEQRVPLGQRDVAVDRSREEQQVHEVALIPGSSGLARDLLLIRDDAVAGGPDGRQQRGQDGERGRSAGPGKVDRSDLDWKRFAIGEHQEREGLADQLGQERAEIRPGGGGDAADQGALEHVDADDLRRADAAALENRDLVALSIHRQRGTRARCSTGRSRRSGR